MENEKLAHELQVARRIQSSLLPSQRPASAGYDFGALMQPMSAVGGDFFDFVEFPDGRIGIAVGDVSDHGVPAALFMSMTVTLLRTAARRDASGSAAEPADVLRAMIDARGYAHAVHGREFERAQDEQIQSAL